LAVAFPPQSQAAVLFNDTFGSSTVNSATNSPTSTSTNYDVISSKVPTAISIAPGDLKVSQAASSSEITEVQGLFTSTPVILTNVNDFIELTVTFTDTSGLLGSATSALYFGLDKSSQVAPYNNVNTATNLMTTSFTGSATGGAQSWLGYTNILLGNGGSNSKIFTRPAQSAGTNTNVNQDVVSNGASGSQSYKNPAGTQLVGASAGSTLSLTTGNTYTADFTLTLTAPSTYTALTNVYSGAAVSGTPLETVTGTDSTFLANGFDALALGFRDTANSAAPTLDVSQVLVQSNVSVPEPASLGLLGVIGAALLRRRRDQ